MMTDLDQIVRESFADEAAEAPDGADLLHRVRHRDRQLTVRRRFMAAGIAVAVTGAGVPAYLAVTGGGGTDSVVTAPTADGTAPPTAHLEPAAPITVPPVPVSAGWLPAHPTRTDATANGITYTFGGTLAGIRISVEGDDPRLGLGTGDQTVAVAGRTATLLRGAPGSELPLSLIWERRIGQWVIVSWVHRTKADAERATTDRATLVHLVETLRDQPVAATPPFRLRWQPRNARVTEVGADYVNFTLPGGGRLVIDLESSVSVPHGFTRATAGRWHGSVGLEKAGARKHDRTFYARLDHGRILMVRAPQTALDRADLLAIAAGVSYLGS